tara:strand:+ start:1057 stop:1407 length:351 start_codon:yes stop_codon:yes gene_type:complete
MEILFLIIVIALAFWYFMMLRGRKAVRAFVFLSEIIEDKSEDEANITASRIDFFAASKAQHQMSNFVKEVLINARFSPELFSNSKKSDLTGIRASSPSLFVHFLPRFRHFGGIWAH